MKRLLVATLVLVLVIPSFIGILPLSTHEGTTQSVNLGSSDFFPSSGVARNIRVAIYDESNTTLPEYATGLGMTFSNNIGPLYSALQNNSYSVDYLEFQDILDHKLLTINYDVFVMVDNYPRESITDYVKEFWLGGGAILSINAAFGYLVWDGMIFPGSVGDDGYGLLWDEMVWSNHTIVSRHPTAKNYHPMDTINEPAEAEKEFLNGDYVKKYSPLGTYVDIIANVSGTDYASMITIDNNVRGGRIAAICMHTPSIFEDIESILVDTVEWLCPKPKGRILFDLTHTPQLGVDPWDDLATLQDYWSTMRTVFVNRTYCFDKLYPSVDGNLTEVRLAPYDMLIITNPNLNYSSSEIIAVENWVESGGGLFVLGDHNALSYDARVEHLNYLLTGYNLKINSSGHSSMSNTANPSFHPATEACSGLFLSVPKGYVNISDDAEPLWSNGGDIWVASQTKGSGRVILTGDMNWATNDYIHQQDHLQFLVNVANWLTGREVLVYVDSNGATEPNDDAYRCPVTIALRDLGLPFMVSRDWAHFNDSLHRDDWTLLVVDCVYWSPGSYHYDLLDYLKDGGRMVLYSWTERYTSYDALWAYMGFKFNGTYYTGGVVTTHIWDSSHSIITTPNHYSADTISASDQFYTTCWTGVDLYANATGIAGIDEAMPEHQNGSCFIVGVEGRVVTNAVCVTQYNEDTDDSTYRDSIEIWENEFAYVMRPTIDHPSNAQIEAGTGETTITWASQSDRPHSYSLVSTNSILDESGAWDGEVLAFYITDVSPGTYNLKLTVSDTAGLTVSDTVVLTVTDTVAPSVNSPSDIEYVVGTTGHSIVWTCNDLFPSHYDILIGTTLNSVPWSGGDISIDIDGLSVGTYVYNITMFDTSGNSASDSVTVTVAESPTTSASISVNSTSTASTSSTTLTTSTTPTPPPSSGTDQPYIIMIVIILGLIILIACVVRSRKS